MLIKPNVQLKDYPAISNILVEQVVQVIVIPAAFPPLDFDRLLLLLLFGHGSENVLELLLGNLLSQLATSCQHDQSVLDIVSAFSFDNSDSAKTICGGGFENLRKNRRARVGWSEELGAVLIFSGNWT